MDSAAKLEWTKKPTPVKKAGLQVKVRPMGVRGHVAEEEIESGIWVLMMEQIRVVSVMLVQEYLSAKLGLRLRCSCSTQNISKIRRPITI